MRTSLSARWRGMTRLALRQLQQRWLESLLILLGIALGVGVFTATQVQLRYSYRVEAELLRSNPNRRAVYVMSQRYDASALREAGTTMLRIPPDISEPMNFGVDEVLALRDAVPSAGGVLVSESPSGLRLEAADGKSLMHVDPTLGFETTPVLRVVPTTPDSFFSAARTVIAGTPFTWEQVHHREPVLVLRERSAKILFPDLTPDEAVGRTLVLRSNNDAFMWTIIGIATSDEHPWDLVAYVPIGTAPGEVNRQLLLLPAEGVETDTLIREAEAYVTQIYPRGSVQVRGPTYQPNTRGMVSTMSASALTLLIAAVSILNLFVAKVMRRQRQTGMSAALGATRSMLFWQVGAEALLLGVVGGLLGIALASALGGVLTSFLQIRSMVLEAGAGPTLTLFDALVGLALGSMVSLIFGFYPAWLASHQHPADALRTE